MTATAQERAEEISSGPPEAFGDEAALVRAAASGNTGAFEELVRSHHRRVYNFLYHMTRQHHDAEDLAQQTFIKAFHHLARFDARRPLINWLLVIARNNALNFFRSTRTWEEIPSDAASGTPSPAHLAEEKERTANIWEKARARLSQREFEVMWLRFAEERSTEETAKIVGLTKIHVKVLVFRARQALLKGESFP